MIGKAVGPEKFAADATALMDVIVATLRGDNADDDPSVKYAVQTAARVCECMGSAFVPYLPAVVPPLFESAARTDACVFSDDTGGDGDNELEEGEDEESGYTTVKVNIRGLGVKKISLNSAYLEDKADACNMLFQ
jgi:hypothetical protein